MYLRFELYLDKFFHCILLYLVSDRKAQCLNSVSLSAVEVWFGSVFDYAQCDKQKLNTFLPYTI